MSDFWVGRYVKENRTQYIDRQYIVYRTQVGRYLQKSHKKSDILYERSLMTPDLWECPCNFPKVLQIQDTNFITCLCKIQCIRKYVCSQFPLALLRTALTNNISHYAAGFYFASKYILSMVKVAQSRTVSSKKYQFLRDWDFALFLRVGPI